MANNTRSKGDSQPLRSLADQATSASLISSTTGCPSSDKITISQTIKTDIDTISEHSPPSSPSKKSDLADVFKSQKQILEDYHNIKIWLQQQEINMNKLINLYSQLNTKDNTFLSTDAATSLSNTDPATKQLRSKQINQLFESTPFSGSRSQEVVDWLDDYNRKCDDIKLDDIQRLSVARGLMTHDAKLWTDSLRNHALDWITFQHNLISYFQLAAGIDCFSFREQLYTRQQQLQETTIQYYHDIMRLCSKVDINMDNDTRLKHLYRGLRRETKITIDQRNFHTPDDFLQELVRLEHLQNDFEDDVGQPLSTMTYSSNLSSMSNQSSYYPTNEPVQGQQLNQHQHQQQLNQHQHHPPSNQHQQHHQQQPHYSYSSSRSRNRTYPSKPSSQYRNSQESSSKNINRHLNKW